MREISVELTVDNSDEVLKAFEEQVERGLEKIGLQAERHAKENITKNGTVDTGLLRNSVSHTVDTSEKAVYIGTNVEYAPYVEYGHKQEVGRYVPAIGKRLKNPHVPAKPFLRPAAAEHNDEYKRLMEKALKDEQ